MNTPAVWLGEKTSRPVVELGKVLCSLLRGCTNPLMRSDSSPRVPQAAMAKTLDVYQLQFRLHAVYHAQSE